jgi:hypothetical protein
MSVKVQTSEASMHRIIQNGSVGGMACNKASLIVGSPDIFTSSRSHDPVEPTAVRDRLQHNVRKYLSRQHIGPEFFICQRHSLEVGRKRNPRERQVELGGLPVAT